MADTDGGGFGFINYDDPDIKQLVDEEHKNGHMGHGGMDHSAHGAAPMDHSKMDHSSMGSAMDHSKMDHSSMSSMDHMMSMSFHGGYKETILFDFWKINSLGGLLLSCFIVIVLGVAYEGVKWFRVYLSQQPKCVRGCGATRRNCRCSTPFTEPVTAGGQSNAAAVESHAPAPPTCCSQSGSHQPLHNGSGDHNPEGSGNGDANDEGHTSNGTPLVHTVQPGGSSNPCRFSLKLCMCQLVQTLLYAIQMILAYALMLIAMTYNSWLFAAVILGSSLGNLLFAFTKTSPANPMLSDHCH